MKLKVTQPALAGHTATVWIDGEVVHDVLSLTIDVRGDSFSTATMTRVLHAVEFDGVVEDADEREAWENAEAEAEAERDAGAGS